MPRHPPDQEVVIWRARAPAILPSRLAAPQETFALIFSSYATRTADVQRAAIKAKLNIAASRCEGTRRERFGEVVRCRQSGMTRHGQREAGAQRNGLRQRISPQPERPASRRQNSTTRRSSRRAHDARRQGDCRSANGHWRCHWRYRPSSQLGHVGESPRQHSHGAWTPLLHQHATSRISSRRPRTTEPEGSARAARRGRVCASKTWERSLARCLRGKEDKRIGRR